MSVSRRKFLKAGIVAAVCAPLLRPWEKAAAQTLTDQTAPSLSSLEQLNYYTKSTFSSYVNTRFRVYLGPSNTRSLNLKEVGDDTTSLTQTTGAVVTPGEECFSLLFTLPPGKPFVQDTYLIKHDALGTFYMFVVPVGAHHKIGVDYYEAIIYRLQQNPVTEINNTSETQRTTAAAIQVQPGQNQQLVYGGVPLVTLPESGPVTPETKHLTKEEQEVYRFRPAEINPPVVAEKVRAPKRKTYPLTLAQSPTISDLKLGMTAEQILALFPGSKTDKEVRAQLDTPPTRFGVSTFRIIPERYSSSPKFEGISQFIFTLLDGRVSTLYAGYDRPAWGHVDEFVAEFSKERKLPPAEEWQPFAGMDTQLKTLNCKEFEISLFANGNDASINYVQIRDLLALQKYKERRAKVKEEEASKAKS